MMTCADFEVLLCDYLDGTLDETRSRALEQHREQCTGCSELARDVTGAIAFLERIPPVEPSHELLTRISFDIPRTHEAKRGWRSIFGASMFGGWLHPILQPKFAMGMAMTILSFSMLGRIAGIEVRQLKPSDLHPAKVWAAADDRVHRTWARATKYYENLRLVYEVQTRLQEWNEQDEEKRDAKPSQSQNEGKEQK